MLRRFLSTNTKTLKIYSFADLNQSCEILKQMNQLDSNKDYIEKQMKNTNDVHEISNLRKQIEELDSNKKSLLNQLVFEEEDLTIEIK